MYEPVEAPPPAAPTGGFWAVLLGYLTVNLLSALAAWTALILVILVIVHGRADYQTVKDKLRYLHAGLNLLANQTSAGAACCSNVTALVNALNEQINSSVGFWSKAVERPGKHGAALPIYNHRKTNI